ncbi:MAG: hypothetical protein WC685_09145 [Methylobacter sp.]
MKPDQNLIDGVNSIRDAKHGIPDDKMIGSMSFKDLAFEMGNCIKDSPKFFIIERELKKRLAQDQAAINRPNMILSACIGLVGVIVTSVQLFIIMQ